MPSKKAQNKIEKKLDKCFISARVKTDKYIRDAVYRNIALVGANDMRIIHDKILKSLHLQSTFDTKYYEYNEFICLLSEARVLSTPATDDLEFYLL